MFGWEEVYMCFTMDDFIKARDAVTQAGMPYKRKIFAHAGTWLGRGTARARTNAIIGNHTDFTKQYRLFVKNEDAEQARYLIRKATQE
jgi:hypothetical protein